MEDRLYKFARLIELGSFTMAAKELHISQPALSMAIHKLERELGGSLLVREHKKIQLTDLGRAAYQAAIQYQNVADDLRAHVQAIHKQRPAFRIGMTDSVAAVLCDSLALDNLEAHADVTIVVNNSRYLRECLKKRQIDLAFVVDNGDTHPSVQHTFAVTETLQLMCHRSLAPDITAQLTAGELEQFICYDQPSATYQHIRQALTAHRIKVSTRLFSTSPDVMLRMIQRGKGVAVLPKTMLSTHDVVAVMLDDQSFEITRPIVSLKLAGRIVPPELETFRQQASHALQRYNTGP